MNPIGYAHPIKKRHSPKSLAIICCGFVVVAGISIAILAASMRQARVPARTNAVPSGLHASFSPSSAPAFDSQQVFDERIGPVLIELQNRDDAAVGRAIARIQSHFDLAKKGAPAFADAIIGPLNGIKTTYLAGKGLLERWWYHDPTLQPVADHVRWNYEQNVTTGPKIESAILSSVEELEQDFRSNRNQQLQAIDSSLRAAELPVAVKIDQKQLDVFCESNFEKGILSVNEEHVAEKGAAGSTEAFVLGNLATCIVQEAIWSVIVDESAAAGGFAATGGAAGAAGGSWIPGPGTIIGAAAGILAGAGADMWVSSRSKAAAVKTVVDSLTQIETKIINGDGTCPGGIRKILLDAAASQVKQLHDTLLAQLMEAAPRARDHAPRRHRRTHDGYRISERRATHWLRQVARQQGGLFAHWNIGIVP